MTYCNPLNYFVSTETISIREQVNRRPAAVTYFKLVAELRFSDDVDYYILVKSGCPFITSARSQAELLASYALCLS